MDCRGDELIQHNNRTSAQAVPFQYLINEQAKSILALQELQNEVGALLEFRDMVMDSFPHLRHKQVSCSPEPSSGSQGVGSGENRWEPGVRVRRKLVSSSGWMGGGSGGGGLAATGPRSRSNSHGNKGPKSGEPTTTSVGTVQDSGFCTESKDSSSTSSRTTTTKTGCCKDEDELWSLLEVIQAKGTKLKLEVQFLQSRLLRDDGKAQRRWRYSRQRLRRHRSLDDVAQQLVLQCDDRGTKRLLSPAARPDDYCTDYNVFQARVTDLKRERDALMDRVVEMEAESLSNAAQIHRLLAELRSVVCENKELEDRLRGGVGDKSPARSTVCATPVAGKSSSHNNNSNNVGGDADGFAPVHLESSTGPSSSSAGRDAYYTPSQHSACNLSSIELCAKRCLSLSPSPSYAADTDRSEFQLLIRPSDPISRNLEGRAASPPTPATTPIPTPTGALPGSPTFDKHLGTLDGIVSSPAERIGESSTLANGRRGTPLPKRTLAAILKTFNPIELQRHLITVSYENKNLLRQMEMLNKSKTDVSVELNKSKEDNEELKFQLEEKRIELEGTMARVRLLQLHQEQHQHGPVVGASPPHQQQHQHQHQHHQPSAANSGHQWLDLVPSNPILPQIALPGTPASSTAACNRNGHPLQQDDNGSGGGGGNGGGSSTESAHHARSGSGVRQPSKIPVVKTAAVRPAPSYRSGEHHQSYPSWNKADQSSLPRYWEPINPNPVNGKTGGGGGASIGSSVGGKHYHQLQQQHHRSRKDSAGNGGASLTRARSQNHHHQQQHRNGNAAAVKDGCRAAAGGGTVAAAAAAASSHPHPAAAADDTNKPVKKLFRRRNLVRQSRCLIDNKKIVLPAVDEVQEPPESMATAAAREFRSDDDDDDELFFDSIESSLATSAASSRRLPPECDSIDLSQPDASLPTA